MTTVKGILGATAICVSLAVPAYAMEESKEKMGESMPMHSDMGNMMGEMEGMHGKMGSMMQEMQQMHNMMGMMMSQMQQMHGKMGMKDKGEMMEKKEEPKEEMKK